MTASVPPDSAGGDRLGLLCATRQHATGMGALTARERRRA
jgi:hypothetical protein